MEAQNRLQYFLALAYPIELIPDMDEGGYFARHPDLPGCTAEGDTPEEAVLNLDESRAAWLEARLESGYPVPEPPRDEFAGRISLRCSSSLHAFLARASARQGVSLNQLLNIILAEWASGVSVKDKVAEELSSLLAAAFSANEVTEHRAAMRTETRTETKSGTRPLYLVKGGPVATAGA